MDTRTAILAAAYVAQIDLRRSSGNPVTDEHRDQAYAYALCVARGFVEAEARAMAKSEEGGDSAR